MFVKDFCCYGKLLSFSFVYFLPQKRFTVLEKEHFPCIYFLVNSTSTRIFLSSKAAHTKTQKVAAASSSNRKKKKLWPAKLSP